MKGPWSDRPWRRALVYGLGVSGTAAAAFLRRRNVEVVGVDAREAAALDLGPLASDHGVRLHLGSDPEGLPEEVDGVVVSPGVPPDRPLLDEARERGVPVIAEVELGAPFLDGPLVGITGSNGKSTTTAMTGALLAGSSVPVEVCGNIGRPLTACVDGPPGRTFVVELSSFQLEGIRELRPRAAAVLNVSPDHLDRHPDPEGYRRIKLRIFEKQGEGDTAVVNADDPLIADAVVAARRRRFSRRGPVEDGCWVDGDAVVEASPGVPSRSLFAVEDLSLPGWHNVENAMAAALLALAVGGRRETFGTSLRSFSGLPHRLELVRRRGGVRFYDDSKATNPESTAAALSGFDEATVHLILGGRAKGDDFGALFPSAEEKVIRAYLVGEAAGILGEALGERVPWVRCGDLASAVETAAGSARPGEVVLLSPACSSFDRYTSFVARGEHFQRLVAELEEE